MKPDLKAPGTMLLKYRYDGPLSNFAFKFNLRRCNTLYFVIGGETLYRHSVQVGRCRLTHETHVETAWH